MKKIFLSTPIVLGMLLLATSFASAYTMWDIEVGDTLKVTAYNSDYDLEFAGAGMFEVTASNGTISVDFTSWCAQHLEELAPHTEYSIQSLYNPSDESAWLLTQYYMGHWTELTGTDTDAIAAQAKFQRALWSFDSSYDYQQPGYYLIDDSLTDYIALANTAVTGGWTNNNYIFIAELDYINENNTEIKVQNLYIPGNPVPEPATMVLFGIGLLGLGALGRKKQI